MCTQASLRGEIVCSKGQGGFRHHVPAPASTASVYTANICVSEKAVMKALSLAGTDSMNDSRSRMLR